MTKHGLCGTPEYWRWKGMVARCHNAKHPKYRDYGARGISVCPEWRDASRFFADMGKCPPGMTLERIDNEQGYSKSNCVWATRRAQAANTRHVHNSTTGVPGVQTRRDGRFQCRVYVDREQVYLGLFDTADEAVQARAKFLRNVDAFLQNSNTDTPCRYEGAMAA